MGCKVSFYLDPFERDVSAGVGSSNGLPASVLGSTLTAADTTITDTESLISEFVKANWS